VTAAGFFWFEATGSGAGQVVFSDLGGGTVELGDVVEDVLRVAHPPHRERHQDDRYQREHYPELPSHRLTTPHPPASPE
jgi:hypothetical protein